VTPSKRDVESRVDDLEAVDEDDRGYTFVELLSNRDGSIYEVARETDDGYLIRHKQDGVVFRADFPPDEALEALWTELSDGTNEDADAGGTA